MFMVVTDIHHSPRDYYFVEADGHAAATSDGQRSSNDSSGGRSNSTNYRSSTSITTDTTASSTSLLSTVTKPLSDSPQPAYYPPIGSIVSYLPPGPEIPPPLQFDALLEYTAKTKGMPEPGLNYFYARRALWLQPPAIPPTPVSPSPSRVKLEALLNQPGAVESEEVWKAGLKNVWKGLVGGNQLRKRLPLSIVVRFSDNINETLFQIADCIYVGCLFLCDS